MSTVDLTTKSTADRQALFFLTTAPDSWTIDKFKDATIPKDSTSRQRRSHAKGAMGKHLRNIINKDPPFQQASDKMIEKAIIMRTKMQKGRHAKRANQAHKPRSLSPCPPSYNAIDNMTIVPSKDDSPAPQLDNDRAHMTFVPSKDDSPAPPCDAQLDSDRAHMTIVPSKDDSPDSPLLPPTEILTDSEYPPMWTTPSADISRFKFFRDDEHFVFPDGVSLERLISDSLLTHHKRGLVDLSAPDVVTLLGKQKHQQLMSYVTLPKGRVDDTLQGNIPFSYPGDAIVLKDYGKHAKFFQFIEDICCQQLAMRPVGIENLPSGRQLYMISDYRESSFQRSLLLLEHQLVLKQDPQDILHLARSRTLNPPIENFKFVAIITSVASFTIYFFAPVSSALTCYSKKSLYVKDGSLPEVLPYLCGIRDILRETRLKLLDLS